MNKAPSLLVRTRALTGFTELVSDLGGDAEGLLSGVGMTAQMLEQPETTISMPGAVALLETAASQLATPDFGLLLAQRQDFSALGPIALIASRANTVAKRWWRSRAIYRTTWRVPHCGCKPAPQQDSPGCVTNYLPKLAESSGNRWRCAV